MKVFKFQKKNFDDDEYLCCKVKGKLPGKDLKQLKQILNQTVVTFLSPSDPV